MSIRRLLNVRRYSARLLCRSLQQPVDLGDQTGQSLVLGEDLRLKLLALPVQYPGPDGGHLLQTLSHLCLENDPLDRGLPRSAPPQRHTAGRSALYRPSFLPQFVADAHTVATYLGSRGSSSILPRSLLMWTLTAFSSPQ